MTWTLFFTFTSLKLALNFGHFFVPTSPSNYGPENVFFFSNMFSKRRKFRLYQFQQAQVVLSCYVFSHRNERNFKGSFSLKVHLSFVAPFCICLRLFVQFSIFWVLSEKLEKNRNLRLFELVGLRTV
jgi:hypothetical protein